jgi:hypothetical protein
MNKKYFLIILFEFFLSFVFLLQTSYAWTTITTNNASQTAWNETFAGSENKTFWVTLPKQSRVIDAYLNLSGYKKTVITLDINKLSGSSNTIVIYPNSSIGQTVQILTDGINITNFTLSFSDFYNTTSSSSGSNGNCGNLTLEIWDSPSKNIKIAESINQFNSTALYNTQINFTFNNVILKEGVWYYFRVNSSYAPYSDMACRFYADETNIAYGTVYQGDVAQSIFKYIYFAYYSGSFSVNNPYLDVSGDGDTEWSYIGEFNQTNNRTANFSSEINTYLSTCTADTNGNCDAPLKLHSDTAGKIQISDINVTWGSPKWSNNQSSIPSTYDPNTKSYFNITWSDDSPYYIDKVFFESNYSGTPTNYTMTRISGDQYSGVYNYNLTLPAGTFYWKSWANASDGIWNSSDTWYFTIARATPYVYSFDINDTYINMNQSILLRVNASKIANLTVEIQKPSGTFNYTGFTLDSNYTKIIDKTILGDSQSDIGRINITAIYIDGQNFTAQKNVSTLYFDYGRTNALDWGDSPDPITNAEGQAVTIWANYTDTENNILTGSTCTVTIFGYNWNMNYNPDSHRYEVAISTYGRTPAIYTYNITCSNSSYQTQQCNDPSQTVEVKQVVTGGETGGGGGGVTPAPANFTIMPEIYNVLIAPESNTTIAFRVCNKDTRTIKLKFSPTGEYSYWVSDITYKGEGFLFQAVPAYGLPEKIDFLILEAGICADIQVHLSIPLVPDSTYEIGLKAIDVSTSSMQVSKIVIGVQRGFGELRKYYNKLVEKIMFGIMITPDVEKVGICSMSSTDLCIPGKTPMHIPAVLGLGSMVAVGYVVWHFTRKKFKRAWLFALIAIIAVFFVIP